ncbi:MAG: flap endonuclease-1 [Candidatus Norongarragalinales archaeon]
MGLTELREILVRHEASFEELRGRIAVDAFNTLYQFLSTIRGPSGGPLQDSTGRVTSHLSGLFYRTTSFLEKGLQPIFVFDGEPSPLKNRVLAERGARKAEAEEAMRKALKEGDFAAARSLAQRTAHLTDEMIEESKTLLSLLGVPTVQAPGEGEAQCAFMAAQGVVRFAASQDFDALLFGAPRLVRNLAISGRRKLPHRQIYVDVLPEIIDLNESLAALGISREKLVWIALLCGTDFNEGVRGIGPKKGLKLVKENDSFDAVLAVAKAEMDWKPVFNEFVKPRVAHVKENELRFNEPDRDGIVKFLLARDFSRERVDAALKRAFREPFGTKQEGLSAWV